jgi:hypothetical protein
MKRILRKIWCAYLLSAALCISSVAQPGIIDRIQSGIDGVARGMDYVGEKAEELIGPGLGLGTPKPSEYTETRSFIDRYPAAPGVLVSISNKFGEIRVNTWEDRVVQVIAEIEVGAQSASVAAEVAGNIEINVSATEEVVEMSTYLPDTRRDMGIGSITVNYTVTIPRTASLVTDNFFGDTIIEDVGGLVVVEAQYGMVDLSGLSGPVKVRTHGEFPLIARNLAQGGVFDLHGAKAEFSGIGGEINVNNFRGSVLVRSFAAQAVLDIVSDLGPIHVMTPPGAEPDLTVTVFDGELISDLPVNRTRLGKRLVARGVNENAAQRLLLTAYFGDVRIERPDEEKPLTTGPSEGDQPFNDVLSQREGLPDGMSLVVDGALGDITIEGIDEDTVNIDATRIVWVPSASQAPAALEALKLQVIREENRLTVSTSAPDNMASYACSSYRINLQIQCPRTVPVEVRARDGRTRVAGIGGPLTVHQSAGTVAVEHIKNPMSLNNQNGGISVTDCSGPIEANVRNGALHLVRVFDKISANVIEGQTIIEGTQGEVLVRNSGGDVRILAIEGIGGHYDVLVEKGNLSMLLDPEADVTLSLKTAGGGIDTALPLTGTLSREGQEFQMRLKEGRFRVQLEARDGNIILD